MISIIGKIVIIIIGVIAIGLLLILLAGTCDLMAKIYRETHKEYFHDNDYYDDEDDDYNNPYYTIKKYNGITHTDSSEAECYNSAMDMAQWKDEQYKNFVSKEAVFNILKEEHDIALMEQISTVSNTKLLLTSRLIDKISTL